MSFTILIVEDELIVAFDLEQRLNRLGYQVIGHVRTASRCLEMTQDLRPDLVLMDIRLDGGMNGINAARELRRLHDVPVVFTSGFADQSTLEEAKDAQAFGFLVKPFGDYEVRAAIEVAIQHHQMERKARERLRFLAQAGAALSSSLDLVKTIEQISSLIIPRLAVGCLVDVVEPSGALRSLAVAHIETENQERLRQSRRLSPSELDPEQGIGRALLRGVTELLPSTASAALIARALGIADFAVLETIRPQAILCIPLQVGERCIGVLSLFMTHPLPPEDPDRTLLEELARRIALALDNAQLYAAAQHAIRLREDVLAMASHDLRGPLSAILLSSELLLKELSGPERHWVEVLRRSGERMRWMIDNLLNAATIEAGHLTIELTSVSVTEIVRAVLDIFEVIAAKKQITLLFTPPAEAILLVCDRERIVEALSNLIQNAIKFTQEGGSISIRAEVGGGDVHLAVTDTGMGIQPEMLPFVFDRYRQAPGASRRGSGLGLYIVKGIIEAHQGRVGIESTPGVGTTVTLILPQLNPTQLADRWA